MLPRRSQAGPRDYRAEFQEKRSWRRFEPIQVSESRPESEHRLQLESVRMTRAGWSSTAPARARSLPRAAATQLGCRAAARTGGAGPAGTLLTATLARRIPVATPARRQTALHGGGQQSGATSAEARGTRRGPRGQPSSGANRRRIWKRRGGGFVHPLAPSTTLPLKSWGPGRR